MRPDEVREHLKKIVDRMVSRSVLENAGNYAIMMILLRTQTGKDIHGNPFDQYSPKYLRQKIGLGKYSGRVDMSLKGNMLNDMQTAVKRSNEAYEVKVGYLPGKSAEESINKARWHNRDGAGRSRKIRAFVGLTASEKAQMLSWFKQNVRL